jgi:hypothetical protein
VDCDKGPDKSEWRWNACIAAKCWLDGRFFRKSKKGAARIMKLKKYFLIFAFFAVSVIALLYGVSPNWFSRTFLDVQTLDRDVTHILRAVAGLYLALGCFWLYAAFDARFRNAAVLTTALFAGGLVAGRLVSLVLDGRPSPLLMLYAVIELGLVPIAIWVFRRPD